MKATGRLRSINCNPPETVIYKFFHMLEPVLDFSTVGGFPARLLPRLDILLVIGARCTVHANEPEPYALLPPRDLQAVLEIELPPYE